MYSLVKRTTFNLFMKKNNPDIALISETNVTRKNNINIVGFKTFRQDKTDDRRGTAIFIKEKLSSITSEVIITGLLTSEATAILMNLGRGETLTVISVYFKCHSTKRNIENDLSTLNGILKRSTYGLIGGDFNARHRLWLDTTEDNEGRAVADWLATSDQHSLVVVSQPKPTFPRTPSTLDFYLATSNFVFILPDICNFTCATVPSDSDHEAVRLSINFGHPVLLTAEPPEYYINYRKLDIERMKQEVDDNITIPPSNRNLENSEIDGAIDCLELSICNALDNQKVPKTSKDRYQHLPVYVQTLYAHRQRLRKRLQRIHHRTLNTVNRDYQTTWSELQQVNIMLQNSIKHYNDQSFQKRLQAIKPGPDAFKEINRIIGKNQPLPDVLINDNIEVTSAVGKVESFANYFEKNFTPSPSTDQAFLYEVESSVQEILRPNLETVQFDDNNPASDPINSPHMCNVEEIAEIVAKSKPKKSSGPDGVSNFALKKLSRAVMIFLAIVLNNCINNCYFPQKWKTAKIVAIPKKGARNLVSNYRPISLLNNISKILEEVLLRRLKKFCSENTIIPDMQFGFREGHSTLHPLLKFQSDVTIALNSRRVTVGCFLDVEKAFDSVWIEALIHKLKLLGLPSPLIKILFSFLSCRKFFVQIGNLKSTVKSIKAGVAQGSKLGPFLYSLMTSDQPVPTDCENLLFADDSLTYASSNSPVIAVRKVEAHIHRLFEYYKKWGIRINTSKSELVCFRKPITNSHRTPSAANCRNLVLRLPDGSTIAAKKNVKYLGVHFNELLRFNPHSRAVLRKANLAFHRLHPLMRRRTGLSQPTKLLIYKQLLRPVIGYSFPVWYTISKAAMKELQLFERKMLRICTGLFFDQQRQKHFSNQRLYEEAKIVPLDQYLLLSAKKIVGNIANHPNQLIRRMTAQERHPEPRYLSAMEIPVRIPMDNAEAVTFYADTESAFHRG